MVGALYAETLPLLRLLEGARPVGPRLVRGRVAGEEVVVLTCGVGPDAAGRRVRGVLARWRAQRVLSVGTCGALLEGLEPGDVRVGASVCRPGEASRALLALGVAPAVGVVTVTRAVTRPQERARLAAQAALCEMEAWAVADAAQAEGRAAAALKVVSDRAGADPDEGLERRDPVAVARFHRLAWRLSRDRLAPPLWEVLRG